MLFDQVSGHVYGVSSGSTLMNIHAYISAITSSDASDWLSVSRPVFLQDHIFGSIGGQVGLIDIAEHHSLYTLKTNLSISVAAGLPWDSEPNQFFEEDWTRNFPDSQASADYVDLCWNGRPIHRSIRVLVDGARCGLPAPIAGTPNVPKAQNDVFRLVEKISGGTDYDRYFSRAGLLEVGVDWPR